MMNLLRYGTESKARYGRLSSIAAATEEHHVPGLVGGAVIVTLLAVLVHHVGA
jgi:hypothetical protein